MPTITVANDLFLDLGNEVHNFSSDSIRIALSNTAPASETSNPLANTNGQLANVTQISYTNYTDDLTVDRVLENVTWTLTGAAGSGVATLNFDDFVITASGGALATFQWIYIYNDTPTNDEIIAVVQEDTAITLGDGSSHTVTINASGLISMANAA